MKPIVLISSLALLLASGLVSAADSMRCGTHVIEADDNDQPTIDEVVEMCGEPDERGAGFLVYKKKGVRLQFDTNGNLMSIHHVDKD